MLSSHLPESGRANPAAEIVDPAASLDPAAWWRTLCWVTDRVALSGDLPSDQQRAIEHLEVWTAAGVTHVVDVRGECSDEALVAAVAPHLVYRWAPTHDDGGPQPDQWFDATVGWILDVLAEHPDAAVLIHCHMGVNRAPSMAMAVLMSLGFGAVHALDAIRSARPIAQVLYSDQVVSWFHRVRGSSSATLASDLDAVAAWHRRHPVDGSWVISRIARRDMEESWGTRW